MDIQPPKIQPLTTQATSNATLQQLQIGQQLVAKVVEQLPTKNDVLIQIGNQIARASSERPLANQQHLKLEVIQLKDQIALRVLDSTSRSVDIASQTLRKLLPLQQPIQNFSQSLLNTQQVISNLQNSTRLLDQISTLNQRLITQTPNSHQLSHPIGLKSALLSSGIFLESNIAQARLNTPIQTVTPTQTAGSSTVSNTSTTATAGSLVNSSVTSVKSDAAVTSAATTIAFEGSKALQIGTTALSRIDTKANLVRLIGLLKSWPGVQNAAEGMPKPEMPPAPQNQNQAGPRSGSAPMQAQIIAEQLRTLLTLSESTLAKITIHQLSSTSADDINRPQWQTEIPILHGGQGQSLLVKIERDGNHRKVSTKVPVWRVTLELNPPHLGLIRCQLSLQQEQVNTEFWAEKPETMSLIRQHIPSFRQQLQDAKLDAQKIVCAPGTGAHLNAEFIATSVLNEKA